MVKIMFVCLGNICRSPMAECIMEDLIRKNGLEKKISISSCGTCNDELGNDIYPKVKEKLLSEKINLKKHEARMITKDDYKQNDLIVCMETSNIKRLLDIINEDREGKVYRLLDFTDDRRDIEDPWYTRNFNGVYEDIKNGCNSLLEYVINEKLH